MQLTWHKVGANIWLHQGKPDTLSTPVNHGHISNVVFVLDRASSGARGWLVGSGPDAKTGRALACSVRLDLGYQVTDVVSTRAHPESVLGAAGLAHARHWALREVQAAMSERCARCLGRLETAVNAASPLVERVALPDTLIKEKQLGPFDVMAVRVQPQQSVALLHHRASDVWILPGVVWGRDLVPDLREAEALPLLRILDVLALLTPVRIVPEQGAADDGTLLQHNRAYWTRLLDALNTRWYQGENQPGSASGLTPAEWAQADADTRLRDQLNVQRAWQQIENDGFEDQAPR
ncbi:MAG: hypothetical protein Q7T78_06975 [Rhodoferax sp.]|nr:hypothetical protein [Rhodoferax sp.]